jgi:hypothetical protein
MTTRDLINRAKRQIEIGSLIGAILFIIGVTLLVIDWQKTGIAALIVLAIGLVIGLGTHYYIPIKSKCPHCNHKWGTFLIFSGGPFTLPQDIRYCMYCGASIDSEVTPTNVTGKEV